MQNQENTRPINGGFFVRLAAYLLDLLIISLAMIPIKFPMWFFSLLGSENFLQKDILFHFSIWDIFIYLIGTLYFIIMTYVTGATVGKRLLNLKVVAANEEKLTLWNVIYRETLGRYLSSVLCIGYFIIGVDKDKRALHDILCDTKVIYSCKVKREYYGPAPVYMAPPVPVMGPMQGTPMQMDPVQNREAEVIPKEESEEKEGSEKEK